MTFDQQAKDAVAPLRVGLLVDNFRQPSWIQKIIADVQASEIAQIVLIVRNTDQPEKTPRLQSLWKRRHQLLYVLFDRFERRWFRSEPCAFDLCDVSPLLAGIPVIDVTPLRKGFGNHFSDADLAKIAGFRLDVLLRFGFGILRGTILDAVRYGIWSHHHGDIETRRGGPPGFWEVMEEDPVTGSVLQKLNNQLDNGLVLYRSFARTDQWSVTRNANSYYWKTAEFVMRTLERVYKNPEYLCEVKRSSDYRPYGNRLYKAPTNGEMARCALKLAGRYVRHKSYAAWFRNQWTLAYKIDRRASRLTDTFYGFRELIPEKDRFWADPFPLKKDDRYYIFFEEFPYSTGKGYISVITLDLDGKPAGEPLKVLEIACHLSYPFVFSWEGEIYMMPETGAKKTIEIYRCERFPDRWRLDRTVMSNVRAVDATLHSSDGLWWLFVNIGCAGGSKYDELHLFFGESPFGPWRPHPQNPIHSDVRSARPAGRLFEYDGQLYRPAQDLSNRRTFGVVIHRVDSITPDEYTEHIVSRLEAVWNRRHLGSHTLNYADGLTVIDVMRRRSRIGS